MKIAPRVTGKLHDIYFKLIEKYTNYSVHAAIATIYL